MRIHIASTVESDTGILDGAAAACYRINLDAVSAVVERCLLASGHRWVRHRQRGQVRAPPLAGSLLLARFSRLRQDVQCLDQPLPHPRFKASDYIVDV